jgi:hypothetical protein
MRMYCSAGRRLTGWGLWHKKRIGDFSLRELADCFRENPGSSHRQTRTC